MTDQSTPSPFDRAAFASLCEHMAPVVDLRALLLALAENPSPPEEGVCITPLGKATVELERGTLTSERLKDLWQEHEDRVAEAFGLHLLAAFGLVQRAD